MGLLRGAKPTARQRDLQSPRLQLLEGIPAVQVTQLASLRVPGIPGVLVLAGGQAGGFLESLRYSCRELLSGGLRGSWGHLARANLCRRSRGVVAEAWQRDCKERSKGTLDMAGIWNRGVLWLRASCQEAQGAAGPGPSTWLQRRGGGSFVSCNYEHLRLLCRKPRRREAVSSLTTTMAT